MEPEIVRIQRIESHFKTKMLSNSRKAEVVQLRQEVMYYLYKLNYSLTQIGRFFKRDHTTAYHGIQKIEANIEKHDEKLGEIDKIWNSDVYGMPKFGMYPSRGNKMAYKWRKVFEMRGRKCEICGYDEVLVVHHIDKNPKNGSMGNLIVLCPNCHAKIHRNLLLINNS